MGLLHAGVSAARSDIGAGSVPLPPGPHPDDAGDAGGAATNHELARPMVDHEVGGPSGNRTAALCGLCRFLDGRSAGVPGQLPGGSLLYI